MKHALDTTFDVYRTEFSLADVSEAPIAKRRKLKKDSSKDGSSSTDGKLQELTELSKQPIRARYLGHVTVYQPIRDQYFLVRSFPGKLLTWLSPSLHQDPYCPEHDIKLLTHHSKATKLPSLGGVFSLFLSLIRS